MKRFLLYAFCFFLFCDDAQSAELIIPVTVVAAEDIAEMDTLSDTNVQGQPGQNTDWLGACVAARNFNRGDIIKSEEILCLGPTI